MKYGLYQYVSHITAAKHMANICCLELGRRVPPLSQAIPPSHCEKHRIHDNKAAIEPDEHLCAGSLEKFGAERKAGEDAEAKH